VPDARPVRRGRRLAPGYTVVEHLARGEALDVYDAWDTGRHCRVAVKAVRPDRAGEPRVATRLRREGRLLARLAHPHLVRAYETVEEPRPMVVLEPLPGDPLDDLLEVLPRPLPAAQVALLGAQLGSAVRYLHAHGQLHLDLKPGNVIVDNGTAKLLDLSLARAPGRVPAGYGTPGYLPPEQARGGAITAAADVWGLGAVLAAAAAPMARRLPRRLRDLIDGCLEPEPARRPALDAALRELDALI
jgi:serine/threonine protein kinase